MVETLVPEKWTEKKKILVILAHPDDPEFFCGGTIARWTQNGHQVHYCILTRGDKGVSDGRAVDPQALMAQREIEQRAAAAVLGVDSVRFLDYEDGFLQNGIDERKAVVRVLREERPDIVLTSDPTSYFFREVRINHADHRAAGQIVLDAVFPACDNPMFFPDLLDEGLQPHKVQELWILMNDPGNTQIDVTEQWQTRIQAILKHVSQVPNLEQFLANQKSRHTADSTPEAPRYVDQFRRIIFQ